MNVDELVAKVKDLISSEKFEEAKKFIEEHKDELGDKAHELSGLFGDNADGLIDKVKGFFGGK
ncbi:hypothetical protein I6N95_18630 [Vagococcus sp. BWB3-3]|uniref:Uncharacterized protein n=1 Tax=Vagococcus allomyrinae TaxID=2794353 RepID=A0A940SW73_9ENTE|nr:hypothetical protein [Vagococcus allomyrinae]MBP1043035.1 hypothetical protein [Vagococcus allomyrinae]